MPQILKEELKEQILSAAKKRISDKRFSKCKYQKHSKKPIMFSRQYIQLF